MKAKYDNIGNDYNATRTADPFIAERFLVKLNPNSTGLYLDIGCGTGNYTNLFHTKGYDFIGIDPSIKMLDIAKRRNCNVKWILSQAEELPLKTDSIDGIVACLTIHHWENLNESFKALHRVLKPNGYIVIFTSTPKQMKGYWLNHYFPKMLKDSMTQMPSIETVKQTLLIAGFSEIETELYSIQPNLKDLFLYCGKQNPKLYLNSKVRNGISSFSSLANKSEINQGLLKLEKDIENNYIETIIKAFDNDLGDYLFIKATK